MLVLDIFTVVYASVNIFSLCSSLPHKNNETKKVTYRVLKFNEHYVKITRLLNEVENNNTLVE